MRKIFAAVVLTFLSVVLVSMNSYAITGVCVNCHTMHNSQDNAPMANRVFDSGSVTTSATPQGLLLRGNCIGCHSDNSNQSILTLNTVNYPIVYSITGYPSQPLAGGNFRPVVVTGNGYGHNVAVIASVENMAPPGFVNASSAEPAGFTQGGSGWGPTSWSAGTQVTCAGQMGCHGDRSVGYDDNDGIRGGHHGNKSSFTDLDGTTVGKSYRFLAGIKGAEDSDWEQTTTSTNHNYYYGVNNYSSSNTISYLCGECHGNFHANSSLGGTSEVGSGSPWLRHPTDIALTAHTGGTFTTDYTSYSTETPVAYSSVTTSSTVDSSSIVMCLSCHAAHANQELDILRFHYADVVAGGGGSVGCLRCHSGVR